MSENPSRDPIETEWGGHPRWQCPFCPRDGGDQALIAAHIADAHPVEPEPEPDESAAESESAAEPLTPEEATDSPPPVETPVDEPEEGKP